MEESAIPPLLGLIGHQIAGNPAQFAIERVLNAADLDWRFLSFDIVPENLEKAIQGVDALGFRGLAIAPSYSSQLFQLLSSHDSSSKASEWVDIVDRDYSGTLVGHNLIAQSLIDWFTADALPSSKPEETIEPQGESIESKSAINLTAIVLGDTGKSVAMAKLLTTIGFNRIVFRDATPPTDRQEFSKSALSESLLKEASLVLRANISDDSLEVSGFSESQVDSLSKSCAVVDLGTNAGTSPLLRFANSRGLRILSLIDLMVMRTSRAFKLWTEVDADQTLLREAFEEYLEI